MSKKYLGQISGGKSVNIGQSSANAHVIITGISGSGKSVRLADIEKHIMDDKGTIIAFDINGTHSKIAGEYCNYISAQEDGLNVKFLDTSLVIEGEETLANLIDYVMETICPRQMRGACQLAAVRRALQFAIENSERFDCEMAAISEGLKMQEEAAALGAYNHLYSVLEGQIFRNSAKKIQQHKINIISLKGLNPKTQKRVTEIMLGALWRKLRIMGEAEYRFTLVIDEFQNIDFQKGSVLYQMLSETRKYGVHLILATQTLAIFSKEELATLEQASNKIFFQQSISDVKRIAAMIESKNKEKWIMELSHLQVGQAITVGKLEIGGRLIGQPIITYSRYNSKGNEVQKV